MSEFIKLDSETWSIEDNHVRFFLLTGSKRAVMIDSGMTKPDARAICEGLTSLPITLINTHGDGDHVSGTGAFDEIHIGEEDYYNCGLAERFPSTVPVPLVEGEIFDLGGRTLRAVSIPGHTKGSFAFLDVERRRIFVGDTVQSADKNIFMFGPHRDREKMAGSLNKLCEMQTEYDEVVSSHGEVNLPSDYPEKVLEGWNRVLAGETEGVPVEVHGHPVLLHRTQYCGFFL